MPLSASPGISLISWFLITASGTPTPVIKWDIKHTLLKHKIKTIFLLYYILYFLVKVSITHLHANVLIFTITTRNDFVAKYCSEDTEEQNTLQKKHALENRNTQNINFNRLLNKPILYLHYTKCKNFLT